MHDPIADSAEVQHEYCLTLSPWEALPQADAIVMAVAHTEYLNMDMNKLLGKVANGGCFIDVKSKFNSASLDAKGLKVWRL
jgi:UDP-N-acetyl-D-galactosamine dehydrogenase